MARKRETVAGQGEVEEEANVTQLVICQCAAVYASCDVQEQVAF